MNEWDYGWDYVLYEYLYTYTHCLCSMLLANENFTNVDEHGQHYNVIVILEHIITGALWLIIKIEDTNY